MKKESGSLVAPSKGKINPKKMRKLRTSQGRKRSKDKKSVTKRALIQLKGERDDVEHHNIRKTKTNSALVLSAPPPKTTAKIAG